MRPLSPIDSAFLLAERRHQPFHVGALSLFRPPDGSGTDAAAEIAARLRETSSATAPFNRRLVSRWGRQSWVESDDFDLAQHFVHLSLPRPGRIRELLAMVSRVQSAHLDRAYPLWRMYLIEGLEDGRIATYSKIHHSLVDGVAGIRLMLKSMAPDAEASRQMPPPWNMRPSRSDATGLTGLPLHNRVDLVRAVAAAGRGAPAVLRHIRHTFSDVRHHHPDVVSSFQAPCSIINRPISGSRRFAAQSYSNARIEKIARAFDATRNDIVLALCGAALRQYLSDLGELPAKPLIAAVPVSIRADEGTDGNQLAFALANLGTHLADPVARVKAVKGSMDYSKALFRSMSQMQLLAYSLGVLAPGLLTFLPGVGRYRRPANVVISHVPGPREPVYWQGCELSGIYPASIVLDGFALNITLISRHDQIDFGIIACRRTLPAVQRLLDGIAAGIVELEDALGWATKVA